MPPTRASGGRGRPSATASASATPIRRTGQRSRPSPTNSRSPSPPFTYARPTAPLNAKALSAISALVEQQQSDSLTTHLREAQQTLTDAAADAAEMAYHRLSQFQRQKARHEARERLEDAQDEAQARKDFTATEEKVGVVLEKTVEATESLEAAARKLVDIQARLEDREEALREASGNAATGGRTVAGQTQPQSSMPTQVRSTEDAGASDEEQEDGENDTRAASVLHALQDKVKDKEAKYSETSMLDRYGSNNAYIHFRRALHDAQHPSESAPPVPRPAQWFDESTRTARLLRANTSTSGPLGSSDPSPPPASQSHPPPSQGAATNTHTPSQSGIPSQDQAAPSQEEEDDDDDDVEALSERISIACPLTLQPMRDPVTSSKCPHSFEKAAIYEMIDRSGTAMPGGGGGLQGRSRAVARGAKALQCPVCTQMLCKEDLPPDPVLARRIQRILQARRRREEDDEDDEGRERTQMIPSSSPARDLRRSVTVKDERAKRSRTLDGDGDAEMLL